MPLDAENYRTHPIRTKPWDTIFRPLKSVPPETSDWASISYYHASTGDGLDGGALRRTPSGKVNAANILMREAYDECVCHNKLG